MKHEMICVIENKNFSLRDVKQTSFISSWDPKEGADLFVIDQAYDIAVNQIQALD